MVKKTTKKSASKATEELDFEAAIKELETLVKAGCRCVMFYFIQRMDARIFRPADGIDADYGRGLRRAVDRGARGSGRGRSRSASCRCRRRWTCRRPPPAPTPPDPAAYDAYLLGQKLQSGQAIGEAVAISSLGS